MSSVSSITPILEALENNTGLETFLAFLSLMEAGSSRVASEKKELNRVLVDGMLQYYDSRKQEEKEHIEKGVNFNVFELWNRYSGLGETVHSRLIFFLLHSDPLHGQKGRYLKELLRMLEITNDSDDSSWTVTAESGRVDVMMKRRSPESVVIIENKSNWATDQENQLYRYWYQNIHRCKDDCLPSYYKGKEYRIVYLVPKKDKQLSENSLHKPSLEWFHSREVFDSLPERLPLEPLIWSYDNEFAQWLKRCFDVTPHDNHALREYIRQYMNYCKTL